MEKIKRKHFWKDLFLNEKIEFQSDYMFSTILIESHFIELRKIALEIINISLNETFKSLDEALIEINKTTSIKLIKDKNLYTSLDSALFSIIKYLGLEKTVKGIEFPSNLRVAHGNPPNSYLDRSYATDYFHSDIWSDEPEDIINVMIYLAGDLNATKMQIFEFDSKLESSLLKYKGGYKNTPFSKKDFKEIKYNPKPGQLLIWDGIVPHNTKRENGGARISIDFRLKRGDPYAMIDETWYREYIPLSRYWYLNNNKANLFEDRTQKEIDKIFSLHSIEKSNLRKKIASKDF